MEVRSDHSWCSVFGRKFGTLAVQHVELHVIGAALLCRVLVGAC